MNISSLDWIIIIAVLAITLIIGLVVSRKSGKSSKEFFLSGRNMPWWLLGISMVATTFSADTPNLVTDIVRRNGIAGNWEWWAFLLTGMLTVFVYARLWRRSGVMTDIEFYEIRYSGAPAKFLRAFRALYLGFFFNVMIMATVCLAAIKIGGIMLGLTPIQTILIASIVTVLYSSLGGLRGVIFTDLLQFAIAMVGSIWAAVEILGMPEINGLGNLLTHENVSGKLDFIPDFSDSENLIPLFIIPLAVQWWSVWYPGSEPGGGGYVAQRMLAAKNEKNAMGATFLFNAAHYALRPWPWILIALASLIFFPTLSDITTAFPDIDSSKIGHDLAYPAMLTKLSPGLIGLVLASLMAAFMSTISTHLNWGASYMTHDFYNRFINQNASEKRLVGVGRISTVILMIFAALVALWLETALDSFKILLQIGAGTGLIFILRWFWDRINAYSEITAMVVSFIVAVIFQSNDFGLNSSLQLLAGVCITTLAWLVVTLFTKPENKETLDGFKSLVGNENGELNKDLPKQILLMFLGCLAIYSFLFATGFWIYSNTFAAIITSVTSVVAFSIIFRIWKPGS